jgi:hypothetical protein
MAGRDPRSPDPDDWFAEPDRAPARRARSSARAAAAPTEEDWIGDDPRPRRARPAAFAAYLPDGWLPIAAGAGVLVVILIAWLAFSGGGSKPPQPTTTAQAATTPAPPTTTQATVPAVPAPSTTLKPGDTGTDVKRLQRALVQLGYTVGTIDGDYGTGTKTAVEQFQTASNLTADGIFGAATRTALVAALKSG